MAALSHPEGSKQRCQYIDRVGTAPLVAGRGGGGAERGSCIVSADEAQLHRNTPRDTDKILPAGVRQHV